jgi:AcrR family transcriptional regulator
MSRMGRQRQPEIRQRLLDSCTDHTLAHGLPDRLTPLAAAVGVSARMLVYHFGTKEDLQRAILRRARQRQVEVFGDLLRLRPDEPYPTTLQRAWIAMSGAPGLPFRGLFGPLRESTEQQLWPDFRREATTDWLAPLEAGLRSIGRPGAATLALAVIRGLFLDLEATGDTVRADQAFTGFLGMLHQAPAPH